MSLYSVCHEGKVLDYRWVKITTGNYHFYLDDIHIGTITKLKRTGWVACPAKSDTDISLIHGFITRHAAAEYLIMYMGYNSVHNLEVQERKASFKRLDRMINGVEFEVGFNEEKEELILWIDDDWRKIDLEDLPQSFKDVYDEYITKKAKALLKR